LDKDPGCNPALAIWLAHFGIALLVWLFSGDPIGMMLADLP